MKLIEKMTGYKAVSKDMQGNNNYQFELGKLHIHDGELVLCESGFHFCIHPSGVWSYRNEPGTRVFKVEAYDVHPVSGEMGATVKYVAKKIKLVEEIKIDGKKNTGNRNTGDWNTGDCNTGHRNTGDWNTGHRNTGYYNTGHSNAGECNTGDWNTGHYNTGHRNTGDWNTGHRNTGDCNTGNCNTGIGNATNRSAGFFCDVEPKVLSFNIRTNLTYEQYTKNYPECYNLSRDLSKDNPIDFEKYKNIPGITPQKLKELHNKFKKERRK